MRVTFRIASLFILLIASGFCCAQGSHKWAGSILFENDLFNGTDTNYTNGIKLSLTSPDIVELFSEYYPDWRGKFIELLPFSKSERRHRNVVLSMGQKIYTPTDLTRTGLITDDRPYAGWLYGSSSFHNKSERNLDTIEIQLGFIGPMALGEEAQNTVHDYRGIPEALGWDNQLENEIAFALIYEHKHRIDYWADAVGYDADIIFHAGAAAGTVFTYANTGIEARVGWQLPQNFGTSLIRPGGDVSDPYIKNNVDLKKFSLYLFTAISGRYVLRDIFLDGNTFRDSHSVEKENIIADVILGASMQFGKFALTYAQVFRSREYETQKSRHNFGSINLSFNHVF
jgi:lipid A 3-O-deacylase